MSSSTPGDDDAADGQVNDALETAHARGDLAAVWFLRAVARGELPTAEHVERVERLAAGGE